MQVIQTINDTIRILFSPVEENFRLLDFLLVQEGENKYLAQIIEIYDDKYDASQNVARVKLFFRVNDQGEVFGYDHFTPSKECEIKKIRREEILTFVNEGREALTIGYDYRNEEPVDISVEFLKNNAVIFADKIDDANNISAHFADILSRYNKHSVIFDYTGALEIKDAKKLKIAKDIKLPLDFYSIDYIWEKGLATASLETQAICREIFNEVQTYAKNTPEGFIPFNKFLNVVQIQYKATPITELTVLLNKLKSYQKNNLFADSKKDFESIENSVSKNNITIVDFSELKTSWHKEFCEFIVRNIKQNVFVFLRLNEINTDSSLINFMYDKKRNIHLVPSVSYSFAKMPHIIERAQNYVLLPTLNPRRDFGAANFELSSMSKDECILFGSDTENFIFAIRNDKFENIEQKGPRALRTIRLKLDETNLKGGILREKFRASNKMESQEEFQDALPTEEELEFFGQFEDSYAKPEEEEKTPVKKPDEGNADEHYQEELQTEPEVIADNNIEQEESSETIEPENIQETVENAPLEDTNIVEEEEIIIEEPLGESFPEEKIIEQNISDDDAIEGEILEEKTIEEDIDPIQPVDKEIQPEQDEKEDVKVDEVTTNAPKDNTDDSSQIEPEEIPQEDEAQDESIQENAPADDVEEINENINDVSAKPIDNKELKEEEETQTETTESFQNILADSKEEAKEEPQEEPLSLEELAQQSIEKAFDEVIDADENEKDIKDSVKDSSAALVIDDNVVIDLEKIKEHIDTDKGSELPIFKSKTEKKEKITFETGDKVEHDKYGKGEIVKVITYANRSLLQINFEEVGKRLLDPDIAHIRKAE